ncbi:MAG: hypothetical protein K5656_08555 [Lachnospiraceae bacterium]|nr:hypothetical protein [Lachnospiraceae bacterium]
MSTRDANIALLSVIPESYQQQIYIYLSKKYCDNNPFAPMSANDIYAELAESRACYERGEYEDFDDALNEISAKYGL